MPYVKSIVTVKPKHTYTQGEIYEFAKRILPRWFEKSSAVEVFKNARIESRSLAIPLEDFREDEPLSIEYRSQVFEKESRNLGRAAGEKAISEARLTKEDIDVIITVTTTGLVTPSLSAKIALDLKLRPNIIQVPAVGWGCCGGVLGLSMAKDYVKAGYKNVLLIAVELCSTTFLQSDSEKENFIGTALFADGAAAVIISHDKMDSIAELLQSRCELIRDTENVMGWQVRNDGWKVIFGVNVPNVAANALPATIEKTLSDLGWIHNDVINWLPHPGGTKVLDVIESTTGKKLCDAWEVLRLNGNMSSVSVLFVLAEAIRKERKGESVISAMGPGFNVAHMGVIL